MAMSKMLVAAMLLFAPWAAGAQNSYAEVTLYCPLVPPVSVNWKNDPEGHYYEDGKRHDITFKGGGPPYNPFGSSGEQRLSRSGQKITCYYRPAPALFKSYDYTIKRDIISCSPPSGMSIRCRLKP